MSYAADVYRAVARGTGLPGGFSGGTRRIGVMLQHPDAKPDTAIRRWLRRRVACLKGMPADIRSITETHRNRHGR